MVAGAVVAAACQPLEEHGERAPDLSRLQAQFDSTLAAYAQADFAGSVLLAVGDSIIFVSGSDSLGVGAEASAARFWIASITKSFTAAAIVRLQQDGLLRTTQPLRDFVPSVPPDKRSITLYHLLTHTSGLANAYRALDESDRSTMLAQVLAEPLADSVGASFRYADDNYSVLAAVVELVSGTSYEEYLGRTFLEPSGMVKSGFWMETESIYPTPHPIEYVQDRNNWTFKGAGGMSSTVTDLFRWTRALSDTVVVKLRAIPRRKSRYRKGRQNARLAPPQEFPLKRPRPPVCSRVLDDRALRARPCQPTQTTS